MSAYAEREVSNDALTICQTASFSCPEEYIFAPGGIIELGHSGRLDVKAKGRFLIPIHLPSKRWPKVSSRSG